MRARPVHSGRDGGIIPVALRRDLRLSLRRIDPRFTLPSAPRRAVVLGGLEEWRRGLCAVGVHVADSDVDRPDLVVAPAALAARAVAAHPGAVILEGRNDRALVGHGYAPRHLLPRPTTEEPSLLVPLEQPAAASYAVRHWAVVDRSWKRARAAAATTLLERGFTRPFRPVITTAGRDASPPYLLTAARDLGVPASAGWVLSLGQGDVLSRNVFHLFPDGEAAPAWVVKFARVAGYSAPFDADERGLRLAAAAGRLVAERAPRLLGRFEVDGVHASVESAAVGHRLRELLQILGERQSRELVDDVAAWIVEFGVATSAPPDALGDERRRLAEEVVPRWADEGATSSLVSSLPALPAVLQHNDLGSWNVIVDGRDFTVVDWESARGYGLPMWDLLYFLADALAVRDGALVGETRHEHTRRLFRGELESSKVLFDWVRRAVSALAIPPGAVGGIATLCWLHHSLSHVGRTELRRELGDPAPTRFHGMERNGSMWLGDAGLGAAWDLWQRRRW